MSGYEPTSDIIIKRGPGRPPNKKKEAKLVRSGIVKKPSNAGSMQEYTVEIVYDNPIMFKKIFGLFKAYNVIQIDVMFDFDRTYMYAMNHHNTVSLMVEILGNKMNSYYVAAPLYVSFDTKSFHNIFKGIGKNYNQISFTSETTFQYSSIQMSFKRDNHVSVYIIELNAPNDDSANRRASILKSVNQYTSYPMAFDINFKELKDKITEYSHITKKINIGLYKDHSKLDSNKQPLTCVEFTCLDASGKINNHSVCTDPDSMSLITKRNDLSIFIAPIWINNIEPLAGSLISDKIRFYVDGYMDMIFITELDLDVSAKKHVINTEKCIIKLAARLAFSEENPTLLSKSV